MKIKVVLLILLAVLSINGLNAQKSNKKVTITGTVLGADKAPISNAIIMIDDQKTNSITDANGKYKVKVKPTAAKIGVFTFGQGTKEEIINGRDHIDFNFGVSAAQQGVDKNGASAEQGVNTGYALVKKKNLTNDASKIDGSKSKYASYHSISEMIQREVSGVKVDGSTVVMQGSSDLFGSVPALIIVDGVSSYELPDISPIYVKSIDVLKGNAASIYGTRGYGGVIIIKTKIQNE
jgi:TonB-dependent SusC/RagA subfamily outer membrane receptor